jgi:hypothetical protein
VTGTSTLRLAALTAAMLALPAVAQAAPLTMGQLMVRCNKLEVTGDNQAKLKSALTGDVLDAGKCWGHLEAYLDLATVELLDPELPNAVHPLGACPKRDELNFSQMVQMFMAWARSHPAQYQKPAAQMVANMLAEKYPCKPR